VHGEGSALGRLYRQQEVGIKKAVQQQSGGVGWVFWVDGFYSNFMELSGF